MALHFLKLGSLNVALSNGLCIHFFSVMYCLGTTDHRAYVVSALRTVTKSQICQNRIVALFSLWIDYSVLKGAFSKKKKSKELQQYV